MVHDHRGDLTMFNNSRSERDRTGPTTFNSNNFGPSSLPPLAMNHDVNDAHNLHPFWGQLIQWLSDLGMNVSEENLPVQARSSPGQWLQADHPPNYCQCRFIPLDRCGIWPVFYQDNCALDPVIQYTRESTHEFPHFGTSLSFST